jgi:hypothetical protein
MINSKKYVIQDKNEFNYVLDYECSRSKRSNIGFSMIVFTQNAAGFGRSNQKKLLNLLRKRVRFLDIIGFFDEGKLCILLHSTNLNGARIFVSNLKESFPNFDSICNNVKIYTYSNNDQDADLILDEIFDIK